MSIATLNSFILLTATCSLTIQCIFMATQYYLLLTWTYIAPQYKRSTLLYFHGNTFSSSILLIMTCNNSKKKESIFVSMATVAMQTCYYITCTFFLIFQAYILSDTLLQKFCMLSTSPPSHSHAGSMAVSSSLLFNNTGKLHREIFEEHYTSC